jgi:hypothetical protein
VDGTWRKGRIIEWVRALDQAGWELVIAADGPQGGVPWQGRYVYDPRAIRPRRSDTAPL